MRRRHLLVGHAPPRTVWFQDVGAWASSAAIPVEFVRCISLAELQHRWHSTQQGVVAIVDGAGSGAVSVARSAAEAGVPLLVVDDDAGRWAGEPITRVLPVEFTPRQLVDALDAVAGPRDVDALGRGPADDGGGHRGSLVMVTGSGGAGVSTAAIALAQGFAAPQHGAGVLLADLCRRADQAMLHDARELVPGLPELVDGCRSATPRRAELAALTFDVPTRGYQVLLGMRRPQQWVGMQQLAVGRAVDALAGLADIVVADVDPQLNGETETGSPDVEDRHGLTRAVAVRSDAVVIVGDASMKGIHSAVGIAVDLVRHGVPPRCLLMVVNRSPRRPASRHGLGANLDVLLRDALDLGHTDVVDSLHLPRFRVESSHRDVAPLSARFCRRLSQAVSLRLAANDRRIQGAEFHVERAIPIMGAP